MSLLKGIREALSFRGKSGKGNEPLVSERERKLLALGFVAILVILAVATLVTESVGSSALQGCKRIIFRQQRDSCIYDLAGNTGNYSMCSILPQGSASYGCIGSIAKRERNISICDMISNASAEYSDCVMNISYSTANPGYCARLSGKNESVCAFSIAREHVFSSLSYCEAISNASQKALCSYIYYYSAAKSFGVQRYCSMLPNETNGTLLTILASKDYLSGNSFSYDYVSFSELNVTLRQYCYYDVATSSRNSTLCSSTGPTLSGPCRNYFNSSNSTAQFNNASAICASAPSYAMDLCTYTVFTEKALAQQNVSSCLAINSTIYMNTCIVQLASAYNDSSYCSYIRGNDTAQQACYSSASYVIK
ncbi:MAG: hypothetical protein KGI06_02945 [Candidatus Micrarchaeota archaeon]|nr:hypothetical protein [Candidatus Micrarchaeota archaeon]